MRKHIIEVKEFSDFTEVNKQLADEEWEMMDINPEGNGFLYVLGKRAFSPAQLVKRKEKIDRIEARTKARKNREESMQAESS